MWFSCSNSSLTCTSWIYCNFYSIRLLLTAFNNNKNRMLYKDPIMASLTLLISFFPSSSSLAFPFFNVIILLVQIFHLLLYFLAPIHVCKHLAIYRERALSRYIMRIFNYFPSRIWWKFFKLNPMNRRYFNMEIIMRVGNGNLVWIELICDYMMIINWIYKEWISMKIKWRILKNISCDLTNAQTFSKKLWL